MALANGRCGEGEEIHSILKRDLSGDRSPPKLADSPAMRLPETLLTSLPDLV